MGTKAKEAARADEPAIDAAAVIAIAEHYHKAKTKHPYFADALFKVDTWRMAKNYIVFRRLISAMQLEGGDVRAESVLDCEVAEAAEAFAKGDKAAAVDELYDAIAVILRMIDVIEGRQKLGKPKVAAKAKAKGAKARKGA